MIRTNSVRSDVTGPKGEPLVLHVGLCDAEHRKLVRAIVESLVTIHVQKSTGSRINKLAPYGTDGRLLATTNFKVT